MERIDDGERKAYTDTLATLQEIEKEYIKAAEDEKRQQKMKKARTVTGSSLFLPTSI